VSALLDSIGGEIGVAVDHRRKYRAETGCPVRARTQLMLFSREFYAANLLNRRDEMIGRYSHIEEYLAVKLLEARPQSAVLRRFPLECPPSGVSGAGLDYDSFRTRLKNGVRGAARRLVPGLWL
jgi:hypothetical protein